MAKKTPLERLFKGRTNTRCHPISTIVKSHDDYKILKLYAFACGQYQKNKTSAPYRSEGVFTVPSYFNKSPLIPITWVTAFSTLFKNAPYECLSISFHYEAHTTPSLA